MRNSYQIRLFYNISLEIDTFLFCSTHGIYYLQSRDSATTVKEFDLALFLQKQPTTKKKTSTSSYSSTKSNDTDNQTQITDSKLKHVSRVTHIYEILKDRDVRISCMFLVNFLPLLDDVNAMLQSERCRIHLLLPALHGTLRKLLCKFIKPAVMAECNNLEKLDYASPANHKDPFIGSKIKQFISEQGEKKFDLKNFRCKDFMLKQYTVCWQNCLFKTCYLSIFRSLMCPRGHLAHFRMFCSWWRNSQPY